MPIQQGIVKINSYFGESNSGIELRHLKFCYIPIFYKSSTDWQWNVKCKNYVQLDKLKTIKRTKGRVIKNIKTRNIKNK